MKIARLSPLPFAFLLACGGGGESGDAAADLLELEYGEFDESDEAPLFGDESFALLAEDREDPPEPEASETRPEARQGGPRIAVSIVWGKLRPDRAETDVTHWDGHLQAHGAAIGAVRTIRFDRADHLLPRRSRDEVAWVSQTRPHHDGISAVIHLGPAPSAGTTPPGRPLPGAIRFETRPFSITIPVHDLADFHRVFRAGDDQVAIDAFLIRPGDCPTGHLRGHWSDANEQGVGRFVGRWLTDDGRVAGHVRGKYGTRRDGSQVLAGKIIAQDGRFIGRMRGTWDAGTFQGRFRGRGDHEGAFRGRSADDPAGPGGVFMGRWAERCEDRPSTMPPIQ